MKHGANIRRIKQKQAKYIRKMYYFSFFLQYKYLEVYKFTFIYIYELDERFLTFIYKAHL